MFKKIIYDFFFLNLNEYSNINVDFQINIALFAIAIGICVAAIAITLYRSSLQKIIKQLTRFEAKDEASARTLAELGLEKSLILKMALSREGRLTRMIGRVGEVKYTYEEYIALSKEKGFRHEKVDFTVAQFYIRDDKQDDARNIIENYGASIYRALLYCVLVIALYVCLMIFMPEILTVINNAMGS